MTRGGSSPAATIINAWLLFGAGRCSSPRAAANFVHFPKSPSPKVLRTPSSYPREGGCSASLSLTRRFFLALCLVGFCHNLRYLPTIPPCPPYLRRGSTRQFGFGES